MIFITTMLLEESKAELQGGVSFWTFFPIFARENYSTSF